MKSTSWRKAVAQSLVAYAIAAAIIWYAARGISWGQVADAASHATLWLFVAVSLGGFLCWFIGETILFARLSTYFHAATTAREVLPTMAAVSFLQIINSHMASGAMVLFLHTRKRLAWLTAGGTLMYLGCVDVMLLALLSLASIALVPTSPIRPGLYYVAGVFVFGCLVSAFWHVWGPRLSSGSWLQWLYERPSLVSFRTARFSNLIKLLAIKFLIVLGTGVALYGQFVSFHIQIPLVQVLALTPLIVALGNAPFSPAGIGTTQLIFTMGFARFAGKDDLFALSLAVTAFNLLARIPMGLAMGKPLAAATARVERGVTLTPTMRPEKGIIAVSLGLMLLGLSRTAHAAEDHGAQVAVDRMAHLFSSSSSIATANMQISNENSQRTVSMKIWSLGAENVLLRINSPQEEAGTAILRVGGDIWYYLPKANRTVKAPRSMAMASWMGSDFTVDDLVKDRLLASDYSIAPSFEGMRGGTPVYEYTLTPKPQAAVVWGKIVVQVYQTNMMPAWQGYYDEDGKLVRERTFSEYKTMGGRVIPTRLVMRPVDKPGEQTTIVFEDISFDVPISTATFSLSNLKR